MTDLKEINFMNIETFNNLDETEKNSLYAVSYSDIPDYTAPITVSSSPFTAPSSGIITYNGNAYGSKSIKINDGDELDGVSCSAEFMGGTVPGKVIYVKKNDIITYNGNVKSVIFFPYV